MYTPMVAFSPLAYPWACGLDTCHVVQGLPQAFLPWGVASHEVDPLQEEQGGRAEIILI